MAKTLAQATKRPNNIGNAVPAPVIPVSPPPVATTIPRNLPGLSPSTHGPTPSVWTTQYDGVKQFYRPGTSQQRFPPLPTKANPAINAQAASVARTIVAAAAAAAVPATAATSTQKIPVNPQAGTQYTVVVGDLGELDTFSNNTGGTVVLPGGSILPNKFSSEATTTGSGTMLSASVTPKYANSAVLFVGSCSSYASQSGIVPTGTGWTALDVAANSNYASLYANLIPGVASLSASATIGATAWAEALLVFQNVNKTPKVVQKVVITSGGLGTGTVSATFTNPITAGNLILVLLSAGAMTNDINGNPIVAAIVASDGANSYGSLVDQVSGQDGGHLGPQSGYSVTQFVAVAENAVAGSTTVSVDIAFPPLSGGLFGTCTVAAYEISLGNAPAAATGFTAGWYCYIQNTGTGTFEVESDVNIDGSASPISLGSGSGLIVAFDGTNWFTERGDGGGGGGVSSLNSLTGALDITAGTGITITPSGSDVEVALDATTGTGSVVLATGPTLSSPVVGTQAPLDDSTKAASTAYVDTAISAAIGSGAAPLPYFFYGAAEGGVTTAAWTNTALGGTSNAVILWYFVLPYTTKFKKITVYVAGADAVNDYDFGIYSLSGTLLANIGASTYTSTGSITKAIAQTEVSLAAGAYFFAITSNAAGGLTLETSSVSGTDFYVIGNSTTTIPIWFTSATASSGGALPSSMTAPTISAASNLVNWRTNTSTAVGKPIFVLTDF